MANGPRLAKAICVSSECDIPRGYSRLKQGNKYLTLNCRKEMANEKNNKYYQWQENGRVIMAFPKHILASVRKEERRTRTVRKSAVVRADQKLREDFLAAMRQSYPNMPKEECLALAKIQMEKGKNRIARRRNVPMSQRVTLAVTAHAWHVQEQGGGGSQKNLRLWKSSDKTE
ncbi:hypothetical protein FDECE_12933 [Fusarium decemcellulare]|nr:hypothetical protein FDECE_12933 [Fusarium decemcellulare]